MKVAIRYSEAFKRQVVKELEGGKFRSRGEAKDRYGIKGGDTIQYWIRRYGSEAIQGRVIRVETADERDQITALKKRIKELERALVNSNLQWALHRAYFENTCDKFGVKDPEEIKKKTEERMLQERPNTGEKSGISP